MWLLFALICVANGDMLLNAILLIDSVQFQASAFQQFLMTFFNLPATSCTLNSIQSETITGAEARKLYFPNHTEIKLFQLIHVTRIQAAIRPSSIEAISNATYYMTQYLPSACEHAIAPMMIISAETETALNLLDQIPPVLAPVVIGVWIFTMAICGVCWVCVFCCGKRKTSPPPPPPPIAEVQPPPAGRQVITQSTRPTAPPAQNRQVIPSAQPIEGIVSNNQLLHSQMKLPMKFTDADRLGRCGTQNCFGGPAAVRLDSWPVG